MNTFKSLFAPQLQRFLAHKRGFGFAYRNEEWLLGEFDRLALVEDLGMPILGEPITRRFLADGSRGSRTHRLTLVRQLARFLAVEEPRTFIPPRRFLGIRRQRPVIRVLSRNESRRFLAACHTLTDSPQYPCRGLIHGTLLRMLLLTGLRRGEAISLRVSDVDLNASTIFIRCGKFGKSRFVPTAEDLAQELRRYDDKLRTRLTNRRAAHAFFPGPDGHSTACPASLYQSFRKALDHADIRHGGRGEGPRLHDLRHGFAVLRLLVWYENGDNLSAKLPLLATYLGHVGLSTSQIYLHMTKDLVSEVTRRHEARFVNLITSAVSP